MNSDELDGISQRVIGCAFAVSNAIGGGIPRKVYKNALPHELLKAGSLAARQHAVVVVYNGVTVGNYTVDLLVEQSVMVELKAVASLSANHRTKGLNYLAATALPLCPLINFGRPRIEIKRLVRRCCRQLCRTRTAELARPFTSRANHSARKFCGSDCDSSITWVEKVVLTQISRYEHR